MASRRTFFFFFLGILSTCCADEFFIITPAALRLDSYETIAIAFDGKSAVEATVNIQDHPGRIKSIAQIKLDIEPGKPEIFKVKLSPSEFPPQYFSVTTVTKKVVVNVSSRTFKKSVVVPLNMQSGYVFIQTDKPIYTPQQTVRIRIVPLGEDALPSETRFKLQIKNPRNIIVEEIPKKSNPVGGFVTHIYKFPPFPDLGEWTATVLYGYEFQQNSTVHFDLQEYVLPTFTVELVTPDVILPSTEEIRGTVTAKYAYGKKVEGIVTFRLGVKGEAPEATFFTIIGPKTLLDGSYTFRLQTDNLKETKIGWLPEIEGARFIVEATVVDFASGNSEVAVNSNGRFSMSPFVISFKRCLKDFRPGLISVVEANILYVGGKPAAGISTKIKASADGKPLTLITDSDVSDEEGKVSFNIQPEMFHSVINITLETADPRSVGSQAIGHFKQQKFESGNQAYIAIDRSTRHKIKPGDKLTKFVHFEPEKFSDTYYLIISKGKILQMDKLPKSAYKVQTVEFEITYDMVPTFRLVVFAQYKDELIADSLKLDVENKCHPEAEIFSRFASHDIGCGPGGGLNVDLVLGNAGILIATEAYSPSEESINSCVEIRRRKREIAVDIQQQCCALGMSQDIHTRSCKERSNILDKYLGGEYQNCSRVFLECCLYAQEREFNDKKLMGLILHI